MTLESKLIQLPDSLVTLAPQNQFPVNAAPMETSPITGLRPDIFQWNINRKEPEISISHDPIKHTSSATCPFCGRLHDPNNGGNANGFAINNSKPMKIKIRHDVFKTFLECDIWVGFYYHEGCWDGSIINAIESSVTSAIAMINDRNGGRA
jgi:hypothetical protein